MAGLCCYFLILTMFCIGCGHNRRMVQLQGENERLLAEYRAQRNQNTQLVEKNAALEIRVAESEKMLARAGGLGSESRISMLGTPQNSLDRNLPGNIPNKTPNAGFNDGNAAYTPTDSQSRPVPQLQWKPVRK